MACCGLSTDRPKHQSPIYEQSKIVIELKSGMHKNIDISSTESIIDSERNRKYKHHKNAIILIEEKKMPKRGKKMMNSFVQIT